jgi:hypothetical protein
MIFSWNKFKWKKLNRIQNKANCMVVMIFHMHVELYINILVYKL